MKHWHHIIPKHMGGTNDSSNYVQLTVAEHAEAHRILFETYGLEEDRLAWHGLAGIIGHEEAVRQACVLASKKAKRRSGTNHQYYGKKRPEHGAKVSAKLKGVKKSEAHCKALSDRFTPQYKLMMANSIAKDYEVTKDGVTIVIHNMAQYCREQNIPKSCMCLAAKKNREYKGYKVRKL
jgi:hypothetical protein